jgi:hypothetical protein
MQAIAESNILSVEGNLSVEGFVAGVCPSIHLIAVDLIRRLMSAFK